MIIVSLRAESSNLIAWLGFYDDTRYLWRESIMYYTVPDTVQVLPDFELVFGQLQSQISPFLKPDLGNFGTRFWN